MGWQAWFTGVLVAFLFAMLMRGSAPPDMVLMGGSILLVVVGIIEPSDAMAGFANPGMLTVAALFIVTAGLRETGGLDRLSTHILGSARTERQALWRVSLQCSSLSALLNNTAVVAMLLPMITDWCRKNRVSPSRLLMPLSYVTVLGGVCTLIGTSTNLVVSGLMSDYQQAHPSATRALGFFDLTWVGVPVTILGIVYMVFIATRLLPNREDLLEQFGDSTRDYLVEMIIKPGCALADKSVELAGLRRLPGLFLIEVTRDGRTIAPVTPSEVLLVEDRLTFAGVVNTVVDLERIPGLVHASDEGADPVERRARRYCEAVVSPTSPLIDKTIRDANFRAVYNAAVIAVHRGGERLGGRIGDIKLRTGDTLLLLTGPNFAAANRNNPDFILVSAIDESRPVRHEKAGLSLGLLLLMVLLLAFGDPLGLPTHVSAFFVAGLMLITRCLSSGEARRSVNLEVLLTIVASFGIGTAISKSGLADSAADLVKSMDVSPLAALAIVYVMTLLVTEAITNNAAAVLAFPVGMALADRMGLDPLPFALAICYAASLAFATPIGYQTNLMVWGPGGYKFSDFVRVGLPLNFVTAAACITGIWLIWGLPAAAAAQP